MKDIVERSRKILQEVGNIKHLGKSICYFVMMDKLKKVWKPSSDHLYISDIRHGYYMVKFDVHASCMMIFVHYLAVCERLLDFHPTYDNIDHTLVWV